MRYLSPAEFGWPAAAYVFVDLLRYLLWCVVVGSIACGGVWCAGYRAHYASVVVFPPPRTGRERRLLREVSRGLAELDEFLSAHEPQPGHRPTDPDPDGRSSRRREP